jgi:hypothetical protein
LDDAAQPDKVRGFYIASPVKPVDASVNAESRELATFAGPKSSSVQTDNSLIKAALLTLGRGWPRTMRFSELLDAACRLSGQAGGLDSAAREEHAHTLGEFLLRGYAGGIVEFTVAPTRLVPYVTARPVASPLARLQSRDGTEVVNLRHFNLKMADDLSRWLLPRLDGSRDVDDLVEEALALGRSTDAALETDGGAIPDGPAASRDNLRSRIGASLAEFAGMALLIA